ncbi:probable RNA-binding protein ARP1 isoform X2 [Tanacetum coccineum]
MLTYNSNNVGPFGDTTLTKVFVGGLAWETPNDALKNHFEKYGDILEAVIINDKTTGRSKGYGFVTFNEPESAKKACENPAPMINSRRPRSTGTLTPPPSQVQWYYQPATPAVASQYVQRHQTAVPYYGYGPATYVAATNASYNHKLGYMGGAYMNGGHYTQLYHPGQAMVMYPLLHHAGSMGPTAQSYSGPITAVPFISKPTKITPTPGTVLLSLMSKQAEDIRAVAAGS